MENSTDNIRGTIRYQLDIAWRLLELHLDGLDDEECLWKPRERGLYVEKKSGIWRPDWPDSEGYEIGPPNIAWLTWHIIFWWSMALDYSFGGGALKREDIQWPGTMAGVRKTIFRLHDDWINKSDALTDEEFISSERTKWPFADKPFYELAAWLNLELMKNASEIGYCRFLYASRKG